MWTRSLSPFLSPPLLPPASSPSLSLLNDRSTMKHYILPHFPTRTTQCFLATQSTAQHSTNTALRTTAVRTAERADSGSEGSSTAAGHATLRNATLRHGKTDIPEQMTSEVRRLDTLHPSIHRQQRPQRQQAMHGMVPYSTTVQTCTIHYVTLVIHQDQTSLPSPPLPTLTSPSFFSHKPPKTCCAFNLVPAQWPGLARRNRNNTQPNRRGRLHYTADSTVQTNNTNLKKNK